MTKSEPERLTRADAEKAYALWQAYERANELAGREGEAVGIDPASGRIWFGASATDICRQQAAAGPTAPLLFLRIGSKAYLRKGGSRR